MVDRAPATTGEEERRQIAAIIAEALNAAGYRHNNRHRWTRDKILKDILEHPVPTNELRKILQKGPVKQEDKSPPKSKLGVT